MGFLDSIMRSVSSRSSSSGSSGGSSSGSSTLGSLGSLLGSAAPSILKTVANPGGTMIKQGLASLAALTGAGASQVSQAGGGLANGIANSIQQTQLQPLQYPTAPTMDLQYPELNYMSQEEAMRQAQGQLGPQYGMSRNNLLNTFQQEKSRLPQVLNARGQLHGGLREGGEVELNQRQNMALENLGMQNQSALAELAAALRSQDQARAQSIADREFSAMQANAQMAMDKWRADVDNVWRENDARQSALARLAEQRRAEEAAAAAAQQKAEEREWELFKWNNPSAGDMLQYQYPTANAQLPWTMGPTPYQEQQLAISRMNASKPSGGGSSFTPNQLLNIQNNQLVSSLLPSLMKYKSYADMQADLPRIAPNLPAGAYQLLQDAAGNLKDVYFDQDGYSITPRDFVPGSSSPLINALGNLGLYGSKTNNTVSDDDISKYLK